MHSSNKKCIAIVGIKFWVKHYKYTIIIEKGEGNFSAYAPDLPGVVATGETEEETVNLMPEAIELHIEGLKEDKLPIPQTTVSARSVEIAV